MKRRSSPAAVCGRLALLPRGSGAGPGVPGPSAPGPGAGPGGAAAASPRSPTRVVAPSYHPSSLSLRSPGPASCVPALPPPGFLPPSHCRPPTCREEAPARLPRGVSCRWAGRKAPRRRGAPPGWRPLGGPRSGPLPPRPGRASPPARTRTPALPGPAPGARTCCWGRKGGRSPPATCARGWLSPNAPRGAWGRTLLVWCTTVT